MKIDLQVSSEEDMEYFKTLFLRNVGTERIIFDLHANSLFVRLQIEGYGNSQTVSVGLFSQVQEGKSTSIAQFSPLADDRFRYSQAVFQIWGAAAQEMSARFFHREEDAETVLANIMQLLDLIRSVG